jgi:hypothetical protein
MGGASATIENRTNVANVPLIVKGMVGQTADLQQWQNTGGSAVAKISATGTLTADGLSVNSSAAFTVNSSTGQTMITAAAAATIASIVKGAASQTADLMQWRNSSNTVLASITSGGWILGGIVRDVAGSGPYFSMGTGTIVTKMAAITNSFIVESYTGQTSPLQIWRNATPTSLAQVTAAGEYEQTIAGNGIYLKSPDGTRYKVTVANGGALTVTAA